jgi:hypothetical protein
MKLVVRIPLDGRARAVFEHHNVADGPILTVEIAVTENLTEHLFAPNVVHASGVRGDYERHGLSVAVPGSGFRR